MLGGIWTWFILRVASLLKFTKRQFVRLGEVSRWLMSDAFDMGSARSLEAEEVLQQAARFFRKRSSMPIRRKRLTLLRTLLGDTDPF